MKTGENIFCSKPFIMAVNIFLLNVQYVLVTPCQWELYKKFKTNESLVH